MFTYATIHFGPWPTSRFHLKSFLLTKVRGPFAVRRRRLLGLRAAGGRGGHHALRGLAAAVELLPPKHSRWGSMRKQIASRRSAWLGGMAAVILLSVVALSAGSRSALQAGWHVARHGKQVKAVQDLQKQVLQRPWFENDPQCLRILSELTGAFPQQGGTIWATSVVIKNMSTINCAGKAANPTEFFNMKDKLGKNRSIRSRIRPS